MIASEEHRVNVNLSLFDEHLMEMSETSNGAETMDTGTEEDVLIFRPNLRRMH